MSKFEDNGFDFDELEGQLPDATETQSFEENVPESVEEVVEDVVEEAPVEPEKPKNMASEMIGQKLGHIPGQLPGVDKEKDKQMVKERKLSRVGQQIGENGPKVQIMDGWMDVDRALLGERSKFYPENWHFRIHPANVQAIRNWSVIDDENFNSVDTVFNEVIKACVAIVDDAGNPIPWGNIRSWDRFFFILLVREYTFKQGEVKVAYEEECPECGNPVMFNLTSQSLMYEFPDPEIMHMYSQEEQSWLINPTDYDVDHEPVELFLPNLQKDANIKAWLIDKVRNKKHVDEIFLKFASWMAKTISKDLTIAQRQMRDLEAKYNSWDTEMFSFMDEVIKNIMVVPSQKLETTCPICGEEVTSDIRFQDGIRTLFNISSGRKKFGKK